MGGSLLHETAATIDTRTAAEWLANALEVLRSRPNVILLPRTTVAGYLNQNHIIASERLTDHRPLIDEKTPRERLWQIRAKQIVLATAPTNARSPSRTMIGRASCWRKQAASTPTATA